MWGTLWCCICPEQGVLGSASIDERAHSLCCCRVGLLVPGPFGFAVERFCPHVYSGLSTPQAGVTFARLASLPLTWRMPSSPQLFEEAGTHPCVQVGCFTRHFCLALSDLGAEIMFSLYLRLRSVDIFFIIANCQVHTPVLNAENLQGFRGSQCEPGYLYNHGADFGPSLTTYMSLESPLWKSLYSSSKLNCKHLNSEKRIFSKIVYIQLCFPMFSFFLLSFLLGAVFSVVITLKGEVVDAFLWLV